MSEVGCQVPHMSFLEMSPKRPRGREQSMPRGALRKSSVAAVVNAVALALKSSTITSAWPSGCRDAYVLCMLVHGTFTQYPIDS